MPDAARGVEGFVGDPIQGEFLALLECRGGDELAVGDFLARLAVLVDDPIGAPGQVVVQRVGGVLGQGADAQPHVLKFVKFLGQIVPDDRDKSRRQPALRNERALGVGGERPDLAGVGHVLGQVQVMHTGHGRGLGDLARDLERRGAQHRETTAERRGHRIRVVDVDRQALDRRGRVEPLELLGGFVDHGDLVVAAVAEHVGDHLADLAGTHNGYAFHRNLLKIRRVSSGVAERKAAPKTPL